MINFGLPFSVELQMCAYTILCDNLSLVEKLSETLPMDNFLLKIPEFQYSFEQFIDIQNRGRIINMKINTHNWYGAMGT